MFMPSRLHPDKVAATNTLLARALRRRRRAQHNMVVQLAQKMAAERVRGPGV